MKERKEDKKTIKKTIYSLNSKYIILLIYYSHQLERKKIMFGLFCWCRKMTHNSQI